MQITLLIEGEKIVDSPSESFKKNPSLKFKKYS